MSGQYSDQTLPQQPQSILPQQQAPEKEKSWVNSLKFWGGKRRRRMMRGTHRSTGSRTKRKFRGGFHGYTPTTGMASTAASFSGVTAKAHNYVGGKKYGRKSRKHRRR